MSLTSKASLADMACPFQVINFRSHLGRSQPDFPMPASNLIRKPPLLHSIRGFHPCWNYDRWLCH